MKNCFKDCSQSSTEEVGEANGMRKQTKLKLAKTTAINRFSWLSAVH